MLNYDLLEKIDYELLKRGDLGNNLRFSDAISYIEKLAKGFLFFKGRESSLIESEREIITGIFSRFTDLISQIQSFQHQPNESIESAQNRRNKIVQNTKNTHRDFTLQVLSISNKLALESEGGDFRGRVEELSKIITNAQSQLNAKIQSFENTFNTLIQSFQNNINQSQTNLNSFINQAKTALKEADETKQEVKNFTVKKLVEKYGDIFSKQANDNYGYARKSLYVFLGSLISVIILTLCFFFPFLDRLENQRLIDATKNELVSTTTISIEDTNNKISLEYTITYIVSRLTILGLLLIVIRQSLKNYNVNMHLYNLNLHRKNSLESFDILISNTEHKDTRDHIIKELAQTIYGNQDSGYLDTGNSKQMSVNEIIEIVKAFKG